MNPHGIFPWFEPPGFPGAKEPNSSLARSQWSASCSGWASAGHSEWRVTARNGVERDGPKARRQGFAMFGSLKSRQLLFYCMVE